MNIRRSKRKTKKELRRQKRKYIVGIILIIFLSIVFVWIMNQNRFKVSKIILSGNKTILDQDILDVITIDITKKVLFVLPRDNIFILNTNKLKHNIENYFPKIYNTQIKIKNGTELYVQVEEREPHSLWCKDNEYESDFDEECFFADQRGYIYTRAPYFSGGIFEKIYTTSNLLKIGEKIMDLEKFTDFFEFIDYISNNFGITVDHIFLNENDETRIYISSFQDKVLENIPYIIFHTDEDYRIVIRNINLMIDHDFFKKDFSQKPDRLKFIDLRISDQIRYKFFTDEEYNLYMKQQDNDNKEITNEE